VKNKTKRGSKREVRQKRKKINSEQGLKKQRMPRAIFTLGGKKQKEGREEGRKGGGGGGGGRKGGMKEGR
jgi:hypothetical protein